MNTSIKVDNKFNQTVLKVQDLSNNLNKGKLNVAPKKNCVKKKAIVKPRVSICQKYAQAAALAAKESLAAQTMTVKRAQPINIVRTVSNALLGKKPTSEPTNHHQVNFSQLQNTPSYTKSFTAAPTEVVEIPESYDLIPAAQSMLKRSVVKQRGIDSTAR